MKKPRASSAFLAALVVVIGLALLTSVHFFNEMNSKYVLVANGFEPTPQILNSYKYDRNKQGLIFSMTFLISSASFLVMVLLPNEEKTPNRFGFSQAPLEEAPKQAPAMREAAPQAAQAPPDPSISGPVSVEALGEETPHVSTTPQAPAQPSKISKDSQIDTIEELDLEDVDFEGEMEITEGEDDVVYGQGEITAAALIDFVHKYPDSSLKFLYRRKLDGKPLGQEEEDIYEYWESRGLTRGKIKRYILQLMEWEEMPREPLYDIWKRLRDHIFEFYGP